ncbi:MAG: hypothetical protein MUD12_04915 [Spirochaetes bacterium]|nr:hypothetical protein [Spirochaetota bacterium]
MKNGLPEGFSIDDIGKIDLREAEEIANEDVLNLTEEDLLSEIDDIDFYTGMEKGQIKSAPSKRSKPAVVASFSGSDLEKGDSHNINGEKPDEPTGEKAGETWVPIHKLMEKHEKKPGINVVEEYSGWVPLEKIAKDIASDEHDNNPGKESKNQDENTEPVFIVDELERENAAMPGGGNLDENLTESSDGDEIVDQYEMKSGKGPDALSLEIPTVLEEELDSGIESSGIQPYTQPAVAVGDTHTSFRQAKVETTPRPKELLPEEFKQQDVSAGNVLFIDDDLVDKAEIDSKIVFEYNELERLTSDILQIDEGKSAVLHEADVDEDRKRIANVTMDFAAAMEGMLVDFEEEYDYRDRELDFIHAQIVEEDYGKYIRDIDEFYGIKGKKAVSTAVEILGLTSDEISGIEKNLFPVEYENMGNYEIFDFFKKEPAGKDRAYPIQKNITYMNAGLRLMDDDERNSIETDVDSSGALIFEEDIEKIMTLLGRPVSVVSIPAAEHAREDEKICDITDKVVILEDVDDVERFISIYPEQKKSDIKKLLGYLDGLFEKLPETTIKNFTDSEYFDLYVKVLNDLGE